MHFDLYNKLMTEAAFSARLEKLSTELAHAERKAEASGGGSDLVRDILLDIYRMCDFNSGLLVPYFFNRYPETAPLSLLSRPFMFEMLKMQIGGSTTIRASRQIGKCVDGDTIIDAEIYGTPCRSKASDLFKACKTAAA